MYSKRQHTSPVHISGFEGNSEARVLKPISLTKGENEAEKYDENWLQNLIFDHPRILPVTEIEPAFFPIHPVCMELATEAGYLDNLYVSENGGLTLVECKLWRNPQARREVVGQVLDYAKELSQWSYEDLDQAVGLKQGSKNALFDIVSSKVPDLDEAQFVDAVSKNLKRGRFLLLIVGDGIREGVENIANFLQAHAGLDFTFGLVELGLFKLPDSSGILVQPRTIAQTYSIERAVISVQSDNIVISPPMDQKVTHKQTGKRTTISEEQFYEKLGQLAPELPKELRLFISELSEMDIGTTFGSSSLNLHWSPEPTYKINFGSVTTDGLLNTEVANWGTDHIGRIDIGHGYQARVAKIVPGAFIKKYESGGQRVFLGHRMVSLEELLKVKSEWMDVISETMEEIVEAIT